MEWFFLILVVVVAAFFFVASRQTQSRDDHNYQLRAGVLTAAERSFYGVLSKLIPEGKILLAKVRVADVIQPNKGMNRSDWQKAFNRVSAKHFDFVVCHADTMKVDFVIELDDKSHKNKSRQNRDRFLNSACESAGLPIRRIKARKAYRPDEIGEQLFGPIVESKERDVELSSLLEGGSKESLKLADEDREWLNMKPVGKELK